MPLKVQLRPSEKVIINSAVLQAPNDSRCEIMVMNHARIMREKHILQKEDANTPAKRLYFCLQMLYIEPERAEDFKPLYKTYLKDLQDTVSLKPLVDALSLIEKFVDEDRIYKAMKDCRQLIIAEAELLKISAPEGFEEEN